MIFPTDYKSILERINLINPLKYSQTRNYLNGTVTGLSPYISRGVISTSQVFQTVIANGYNPGQIEKFIQELSWRDYWQQLWVVHKSNIDSDLKFSQPYGNNSGIPVAIVKHETGILAIDNGIQNLYDSGYMHNHLRMYVASLACNVAKCSWKVPAQWMYYHLLDGDWASNALSWQWVCGANSNKVYYANQENINKYCNTSQNNTFLDIEYEKFSKLNIPESLLQVTELTLQTPLPKNSIPEINNDLPTLIYNFYNLDPEWRKDLQANRILLLEPSVFEKYPVSQKSLEFCLSLAKENISHIKFCVAEFHELHAHLKGKIYFKEHPLNNYKGHEDSRNWMTTVAGDFPSFFSFWKQCKKELIHKL